MSALQFGLTPKMKPLPPNRSVLVAALDVGTSKIACLIARLRPSPPEDSPRLRSHSIDVVGFGHTLARGMKAGTVIDLAEAEAAVRQCADLAERTAKMQLDSVIISVSAGRPTSELISAAIPSAPDAPCCIRFRSVTCSTTPAAFTTRAACSRANSASTCTS